jgi:GntR family transcriptional regulator
LSGYLKECRGRSSFQPARLTGPDQRPAVFRQIADHPREAIDKGRLAEGAKLPSESELVEHFGKSRMTVRNALSILQSEGLIHAEHGKGVFVRPRPPVRRLASDRFARRHREQGKSAFAVEAEAVGSHPEVENLEIKEKRPSPDISARLGAPRRVLARRRRYLLDGRPVEFAASYLPLDLARDTPIAQPDPGPGGIYARLEELGHQLNHFEEEIRARMPSPQEFKTLRLASGMPVIHLIRTAYDAKGRAVEVCDTVMAADAYVLSDETLGVMGEAAAAKALASAGLTPADVTCVIDRSSRAQ